MDYFKYFIKKFFRKNLNKLLFILILISIFCMLTHSVFATTVENIPNTDIFEQIKTQYNADWYNLLYINMNIAKTQGYFTYDFQRFCSVVTTRSTWYYWFISNDRKAEIFLKNDGTPISTSQRAICYGISSLDDITYSDRGDLIIMPGSANTSNSNSRAWRLLYPNKVTPYITTIQFSGFNPSFTTNQQGRMLVPDGLHQYCPTDIYDDIYRIGRGEFSISSLDNKISEISQKLTETNNKIEETNEFLKDDTISDYSTSDLPTDSMNDITIDGFNNIFNTIRNSFSSDTSQTVDFTIPYLDYTVSVNSFYIRNSLIIAGFQTIVDLFTLFWYSSISLFIVKDIYKYINQIKNGDIGHTDTNIKADML